MPGRSADGTAGAVTVDALSVAPAPSVAMGMTYVAMADSIGIAMANAVMNQQSMQSITNAAVVRVVAMTWLAEQPAMPESERGDYTGSVDDAVAAAEWHAPAAHLAGAAHLAAAKPPRAATFPIRYADAEIGELALTLRGDPAFDEAVAELCQEAGRRCALFAKRHELHRWAEERCNRPALLIGTSAPLLDLELALERASGVALPALIRGEFGTEKPLAAMAIHCFGPSRGGPFVEVNGSIHPQDAAAMFPEWLEQARGGTLFLNGADELHPQLQSRLIQPLSSRMGQWVGAAGAPKPRIVASTTADLHEMVKEGRFSRALLAELDFLSFTVPPLRERTADMDALITAILERLGYRAAQKRTDALVAICEAYPWPENMIELERTIARLAVMTDSRPITRADVLRLTPWLVADEARAPVDAALLEEASAPKRPKPPPAATDRWARCVITKDFELLPRLHEGMQKALLYLSDHFQEQISLGQIARYAHVSPSHLSYLFKTSVGITFKPFLGRVRVEKAKEILSTESRQRITDVALNVGFTDLSHFEKLFRRIVGASPRAFRRATEVPIQYDA